MLSSKRQYEPISQTDSDGITDSETTSLKSPKKKKKQSIKNPLNPKLNEVSSCRDLFMWFRHDPIGRWPIFVFLITFFLSIILIVFYLLKREGGSNTYILLGVLGLLSSIFGFNHIRMLMNLIQNVDEFAEQNATFKGENDNLQNEVDGLASQQEDLIQARKKIAQEVDGLRQKNEQLDELNNNLSTCNVTNLEQIKKLLSKSEKIRKQWKEELIQKERDLLNAIFDSYIVKDPSKGMTREEYDIFCRRLPEKWLAKIRKVDFFKHYANEHKCLNYGEFGMALDIMMKLEIRGLPVDKFEDLYDEELEKKQENKFFIEFKSRKQKNKKRKSDFL